MPSGTDILSPPASLGSVVGARGPCKASFLCLCVSGRLWSGSQMDVCRVLPVHYRESDPSSPMGSAHAALRRKGSDFSLL